MATNESKESMSTRVNRWISNQFDVLADWLAARPGLIPLVGLLLIVLNFVIALVAPSQGWLARTDLFLHLGLIVSIIGLLIIKPLQ